MNVSDIAVASTPSAINVQLQKSSGEQVEKVVGKLLESVEATAPSRSGHNTGHQLNVTA